jgi:hypothetical protein
MPIQFRVSDAFWKETVFRPVAERIGERGRDSLLNVARFPSSGIEGWLKVEATRALGDLVTAFQNNGPDLKLTEGRFIELKGATDCNPRWILSGLKYSDTQYPLLACLFLGSDKAIPVRIRQLEAGARMIDHATFSAGHEWVVGLIVRRDIQPIVATPQG